MTNSRNFIASVFLFFTLTHSANAMDSTVPCPSLEILHQSANAINDAAPISGYYMAATGPFAIQTPDMGWFAVVYSIPATSINDAINKGRLAMLNASRLDHEFAQNFGGTYVCKYDGRKIEVISNDYDWRKKVNLLIN